MKTYIPDYVVSVRKFSASVVPIGELIGKSWTTEMIELLGDPASKNRQGVRFWTAEHVKTTADSLEFRKAVAARAQKMLQKILGGGSPVHLKIQINEQLIADGCLALRDLNKHIKAKKFRAAESSKAYELKAFFVQYLYQHGYVTAVNFETDTKMFRFDVTVAGNTFVWHQPKNQVNYIPSCLEVISKRGAADYSVDNDDHNAVLLAFEVVALRLLMSEMDYEAAKVAR